MARITNSDQIALALQARLKALKKKKKATSATTPERASHKEASESSRLIKIVNEEKLDENTLTHRIVSYLLEEEFGAGITDDRRFAKVIHRVSEQILQDDASRALLNEAIIFLRTKN